MRIDLHTHSTVSDGTDTPTELVTKAAAAGLEVVAITDHDSDGGWAEALQTGAAVGIDVVPGIEVSTRSHGRGVHLLAYWPEAANRALADRLEQTRGARDRRLPRMVEQLQAHGIDITAADVRAHVGDATSMGRPHVADALVAMRVVASRDEAFEKWLVPGRPGYVPKDDEPDTGDAIALVVAAGGVPVIAHPWGRSAQDVITADLLAEWQERGLVGIEVDHQDHDADDRAALRMLAEALDLVVTGSSDFHGIGKTNHDLGCNMTTPEALERLRAARRPG